MPNTPSVSNQFPRGRGATSALDGEIMTDAEIIEMDRQFRSEYHARKIRPIAQPVSLAGPRGKVLTFRLREEVSPENIVWLPRAALADPNPPRGGAPAALPARLAA